MFNEQLLAQKTAHKQSVKPIAEPAAESAKKSLFDGLTDEQLIFYAGKKKLQYYDDISKTRPLTEAEDAARKHELETMYAVLIKYIYHLMRRNEGTFAHGQEARAEIVNEFYCTFHQKLEKYDPLKAAPITYFKKDILGTIANYIRQLNPIVMTKNDVDNVKAVRKGIRYFESTGSKWDEARLSKVTGLSVKVVKRTLSLLQNSGSVADVESVTVPSYSDAPEAVAIQNERTDALTKGLQELLTEEERRVLFARVNISGKKELNFSDLERVLGMDPRKIKRTFSQIQSKLQDSDVFREMFPYKYAGAMDIIDYQDDHSGYNMAEQAFVAQPGKMRHRDPETT